VQQSVVVFVLVTEEKEKIFIKKKQLDVFTESKMTV